MRGSILPFSFRMKIALTDYGSLEEVLRAITDLPYEGGSRRIGDALQFLVDHMFSPVVSRDYVPKVRYFTRDNSFRGLSFKGLGCVCLIVS